MLQERIGNHVLHHQLASGFLIGDLMPRPAIQRLGPKLVARGCITPVAECPLRILHDIALVDQRHAPAPVGQRIADRRPYQPPRPFLAYRLDPDS